MSEPTAGATELDPATRERLEQELAQAREQRDRRAAELGGEDAPDVDSGDSGDQAVALEGLADLSRMDDRIDELQRRLAGAADVPPGLPDGTIARLRFPDGDEATLRVVAIPEQAAPDDADDVLTASSPLGQALLDAAAGDTVTYRGPDGELSAEVLELRTPS